MGTRQHVALLWISVGLSDRRYVSDAAFCIRRAAFFRRQGNPRTSAVWLAKAAWFRKRVR